MNNNITIKKYFWKIILFLPISTIMFISGLLKGFFGNLLMIIILTITLIFFIPFKLALIVSVILNLLIYLIIEFKFVWEPIISTNDYLTAGIYLSSIYIPKMKPNEKPLVSLKIKVNNNFYRVVRFSEMNRSTIKFSRKERKLDRLTGFIILKEPNYEIVSDRDTIKKVSSIYNVWYHLYINPLFKELKLNKYLLKNYLKFDNSLAF